MQQNPFVLKNLLPTGLVALSLMIGQEPVTVTFHAGTYYLANTIQFTAADSGTAANPVTYRAATGETVALSGGNSLATTTRRSRSPSPLFPEIPFPPNCLLKTAQIDAAAERFSK
jgi:hypothetical protein